MIQSIQDTHPNLARLVMRRIIPVIGVAFLIYVILIGISVNSTIASQLTSSHEQATTRLDAQLRADLNFLLRENQEVANTGTLRSQADALLLNNVEVGSIINNLFSDIIRLNPTEYVGVQYITSNGAVFNEVVNSRGIPQVSGNDLVPRSEPEVIQSQAFQSALQSISPDDFFISDMTLRLDEMGNPVQPLQPIFSVYVPVFDLVNPRTPLGTVRFIISAEQLLNVVNNPILGEGATSPGRQFFLVDNQNNVLANSNAPSQDYLFHLIDQELEQEDDEFHDIVTAFLNNTDALEVSLSAQDGILYTVREFNTGDSVNTSWRLIVTDAQSTLFARFAVAMVFIIVATIVVLLGMMYTLNRVITPVLTPISNVSQQAQQIASGQRGAPVQAEAPTLTASTEGEAATLPIASALTALSDRISQLNDDISNQSTRHSRDMQIITNIGRETATLYDIDMLLQRSIELICNELGFYHAQVFLIDDARVNAVLVKSRGEAGQQLLERGHQLGVGSDSVIGRVTSQVRPVIVNDTIGNDGHGFNPLLPDTRAEMALPLVVANECIGALDIQSTETNVFHREDIPKFQLIADQLAVAVNNARLREQSDQRIDQINRLNRQLTREAWRDLENELGLDVNYSYNLMDIQATTEQDIPEGSLVAPISIRGEVIGTLNATPPEGQSFSDGDQAILRAVAERVALAIDNARLFQETQVVLSETEILYELSRKLSEANTYDELVSAIIQVVVTNAHGGQIWIFDDYITGEQPEWAELRNTTRLTYTDDMTSSDIRLHLPEHPLMNRLNGASIVTIPDIVNDPDVDNNLRQLADEMGAKSIVFIPLSMRGQWKGFMTIYFDQVHDFTDRETRIYNALIDQAGVAIDNRLLLEQTENALERNEKLYASSRIINTAQSLQDLVYAAVATTSSTQVDFWLGIFEDKNEDNPGHNRLQIVARSEMGNVMETSEYHIVDIPADSPMRHREPEIVSDNTGHSWMWDTAHAFISAFPLFSDNQPLAIFFIVSYEDYQLSDEDYEVYRALTGQMSTQIQNSRLLRQTEQALAETQRLYIASRAIAGATDIDSIFESAAGHLALPFMQSATNQRILISLIATHPNPTPTANQMQYRYQWTSDANIPFEVPTGAIVPVKQAPFAKLFDNRAASVNYNNLDEELTDNPAILQVLKQDGGQSAVVSVLQTRQNWYGVLICKSNETNAFDERYVDFVQAVANQISIGIENQILFTAAQSERERLQTILSTLPTGVMVLDPQTFVPILVNESTQDLLGDAIDTNKPFSPETYQLYHTDSNQLYSAEALPIYLAAETGDGHMADDVALITDDYRIELLLNAAPIFDAEGNQTAIVVAVQDISNLRNLEQTLQSNLSETVSLYETQRSVAQAESLDELLDTILVQMLLLQPDDALILINDELVGDVTLARQMTNSIDDIRGLKPILPDADTVRIADINTYAHATPESKFTFKKLQAQSALIVTLRVPSRNEPLGWLMLTSANTNQFNIDDERSLVTLSDMARTAIDNRYLVQSSQRALQETQTLFTATTMLTRAGDMEGLGIAVQQSITALQPDMYAGFVTLSPGNTVTLFNDGFDDSVENGMDMDVLRTARLPERDSVYISDVTRTTNGIFEQEILKGAGIKSFTAVNLRMQDSDSGRILLGWKDKREFTEGEIRYLSSIADSASVVIDNQALLGQIQSTLQETSVLYQSSRALTDATTSEEIIDVVVDYLIGPHVNQVFVALLNTRSWNVDGATVEVEAGWQADGGVNLQGVTLSADQFPAWDQLSSQQVLIINDIYDESLDLDIMQRTSIESLDTRSLVVIPLRVSNRSIGSIWIGSRTPHHYDAADARIYQSFAESASLSLEASYLFGQTEHRARQLETSAEVGQQIGQLLDLDILLPQVVDLIRDRFGYDHVQVFLMDNRNEFAELQASTGEAGRQLLANQHKLARGSSSVIGQVTEKGEPTIALDTADANVVHQPNQFLPLTRSEMALPLWVKGRIVGALDVQSNQPNAFTDEDIRALTTLSGQIAIAIDNANLYNEIERRAADMGLLFDITVIATASETLEEALQAVTDKLYEAFNASSAVFYLPRMNVLHPIALSGSDQPLSELSHIVIGDAESLIGLASGTLNSQLITDIRQEVRYLSIAPHSNSAMIVPISTGGRLIGLIVVEHEGVEAFSQDDLQVVITLAGSLSAVVQNSVLLDELQQSNEQLREVDRLKSQFLANMSHELRTPLNSIIGFSRVMLKGIDGALTEMQEQDLTTIYNSGQHLLNLINDILDQAKIESGKMDLKFAYFGVKTMIESVRSIGIGLVKEKSIDMFIDIESSLPQAYGDEFRTRQILLNLVSNASKFTQAGSITIRAYTVAVKGSDKPFVRIDVVDTGIGIDEKEFSTLFETFRQVDSSLTRTVGGTGLGLPLSKSLAEMQGGELLVESVVGEGSVFSITIPTEEVISQEEANELDPNDSHTQSGDHDTNQFKKPDTQTSRPTVTTQTVGNETPPPTTAPLDKRVITQTMKQTTKREILLIEDNKDMVDQFRRLLQREGFEVQTADHPAYAEAMVSNLRPTVLVMDVNFADGKGWDILENLKNRDDTFDIPIVVCSVNPETEKAYQMGAHAYISRPFTNEEIVEAVLSAEKESQRERILIIDDQEDSVRLLQGLLNENGNYRIFYADNGTEGISLVARRRPDLIILDLRMPGMDGFAVLKELRSNPETADIPVMIVTGEVDLSADEQQQLANVHVLHKTNISEEEFEQFVKDVRQHLDNDNGS